MLPLKTPQLEDWLGKQSFIKEDQKVTGSFDLHDKVKQ